MKCDKAVGSLEAYLGGTLSEKQRKVFEKHVAQCEVCRAELEKCRKENTTYRQALSSGKLQGTLRNTVISRLRREYKPAAEIQRTTVQRRRTALWLAPVAAAAQFLLAFWLSGTLIFKSVSEVEDEVLAADSQGRVVAIKWVRDLDRHKYFTLRESGGMSGPEHAPGDVQVD